jgi:alanine-synthesizing transaminase
VFSSRLRQNLAPNPLTITLERRRSEGSRILDLTISNPTRANLPYPAEEICSALGDARSLRYEPHPLGLLEARDAVSQYYGGSVPPSRILLTSSTSEAYSYLFKLLCNPNDEVLTPRPSYPLFDFLAELESVRVCQYPLFYDHGWHVDIDGLHAAVTERTRAVIIVNPNNPTGSFLKRGEYESLARICAQNRLALISDEVFSDFTFKPDEQRVATVADRHDVLTFALSGLSKTVGLPQMKLGWIVASGPGRKVPEALARLEIIADTFLSVSTPIQWATGPLLSAGVAIRKEIQVRTERNLSTLRRMLDGTSLRVLEVEAGWYATVQAPRIRSEEQWAIGLLAERGVLVQPGFLFDFAEEAFFVLSLLTPEEVFEEGVALLIDYVILRGS